MKILTLSDVASELVYSPRIAERFGDIDVVLSCGDLPFDYLEYVVTMLGKKLYYVYGNHAQHNVMAMDGSIRTGPQGCVNIHHKTVSHSGLLIAGLEGSMRYNEREHQYTERQMRHLVRTMAPRLWRNAWRYGRALDVLITHAPPRGIHDAQDLAHQGFRTFLSFMDRYKPRYLVHGHTHLYRRDSERMTRYGDTIVVNTYGYQVLEIDETTLGRRR